MIDHLWKIIGIVAILAIGGSIAYSNHVANEANTGIEFAAHIKGSETAAVKLTEYSDFQCPACGQFAGVLKDVMEQYPNDVQLEYKHYPLISLHPFAIPAAKAAEAAGQQGKFFEMHDMLFENQQVWSKSANPTAYFLTYAEELNLDVNLFKRHMKASKIQEKIEGEFKEARDLGLSGTPTMFLNGKRMQYTTYDDFMSQIKEAVTGESAEAEPAAAAEPDVTFGL